MTQLNYDFDYQLLPQHQLCSPQMNLTNPFSLHETGIILQLGQNGGNPGLKQRAFLSPYPDTLHAKSRLPPIARTVGMCRSRAESCGSGDAALLPLQRADGPVAPMVPGQGALVRIEPSNGWARADYARFCRRRRRCRLCFRPVGPPPTITAPKPARISGKPPRRSRAGHVSAEGRW